MADIRIQKQLYHLTDIENIHSIFQHGILPALFPLRVGE